MQEKKNYEVLRVVNPSTSDVAMETHAGIDKVEIAAGGQLVLLSEGRIDATYAPGWWRHAKAVQQPAS